ncbi:hypothetical protein CERZMDRAFT_70311 [Cercospora zeae-maydis SCOH1-5]|uniref:Uncharacterized protein n=1 Tax=Cercospora zeae-maydis SCOH1-5 TaxID=717836 RepID=A0A6A6F747_9PEZI|nr:hypothetical protein CERZMDRAFT_70311 [Cercospora zeae-maydis SCOH1-5]
MAGDSDLAIVAGTSLLLNPDNFVAFSKLGVLGSHGKSFSMDHRAEGYGRGEGVAVVILKRAQAAYAEGDFVHSIIRSSAINQDGKTATLTSPSMEAQAQLIRECYAKAGLAMDDTAYVEAHVTGTSGDPIEVEAITATLARARTAGDPLCIGSIKPNIGHTEAASGLASLIKTSLILRHRLIPPNINFEHPHPRIRFAEWNAYVPVRPLPWPANKPLRASVNNFGYGGTNTHLIVEAAPPDRTTSRAQAHPAAQPVCSYVFAVSSKDAAGMLAMNQALATYLESADRSLCSLRNLAYTLSERRSRFAHTTAIRAHTFERLRALLSKPGRAVREISGKPYRIGFVFNGQGGQWHAMGRELVEAYPAYRKSLHRADDILRQTYGAPWSLVEELSFDESNSRLHDIEISPPVTVAVQICLVDLLQSWGIVPCAVVSHSSGEISAAHAAGVLTFEEALGVAFHRGRLAHKHEMLNALRGGMLAAKLSAEEAQNYLGELSQGVRDRIVVACINSPSSVTLSGDCDALDELAEVLKDDAVLTRRLKVPCAYHSPHMQHMAADYHDVLTSLLSEPQGGIDRCPRIPFASPATGKMVADALRPHHWVQNLTNPVLFSDALRELMDTTPLDCFLEIGAHDTLSSALLGTPTPGANGLTPTWRNILRVDTFPWLNDHQIQGQVVFPAAGYVAMAIEAVRMVSPTTAVGYQLRDVNIVNALVVPSSLSSSGRSGVETVFTMRSCSEKDLDHDGWYEFGLVSVVDGSWTSHCTGSVKTVDSKLSTPSWIPDWEATQLHNESGRFVTSDDTFSVLRRMEIWHGPEFQNLIGSRVVGEQSLTELRVSQQALTDPFVLHPTTLDSLLQSCYSLLHQTEDVQDPQEHETLVPRSIHFLSVPAHTSQHMRALSERQPSRKGPAEFHIQVVADHGINGTVHGVVNGRSSTSHGSTEQFPFEVLGLSLARLHHGRPATHNSSTAARRIHSKSTWELCVTPGIPNDLKDSMRVWLSEDAVKSQDRLRRASCHMLLDAYSQLKGKETSGWTWHHQRFYQWMKTTVQELSTDDLGDEEKRQLYETVAADNSSGELTCRVGKQLANIIQGNVTPLELMLEGDLLNKYYREIPQLIYGSYRQLKQILRLYAAQRPGARVLEVGAGTGGTTEHVLDAFAFHADAHQLAGDAATRVSLLDHYEFTDISSGFFASAKTKFASWNHPIHYRTLDIEKDPCQQGFVEGSFDLVIAAQVLHATANLGTTLSNVRRLLKPEGKLIMLETTQDAIDTQLVFGTLPGWWLGKENHRKASPNVSVDHWDAALKQAGFNGVEFELPDCENRSCHLTSILMATAQANLDWSMAWPPLVRILYDSRSTHEVWLEHLAKAIEDSTGSSVVLQAFDQVEDVSSEAVVVATMEMATDFLYDMDDIAFERLRKICTNGRGVLWLSYGGVVDAKNPLRAQIQGVFRTLRREDSTKRYVSLDFDTSTPPWEPAWISHVLHVFRTTFNYSDEQAGSTVRMDWEYGVRKGQLHVPRLWPDARLDSLLGPSLSTTQMARWQSPGSQRTWKVDDSGSTALHELVWAEENIHSDDGIPEDFVEIEPRAFGLNFKDVLLASGIIKHDEFPGHEGAGIVTRIGTAAAASSGFKVGQRVCGVFKGRFSNTPQALWTSVFPLPDNMAWEEGAAIPYAYGAAHIALHHIARLSQTDRVLIHSAAGGVGQAAVVLAQAVGAEIFVTCSSEEKRAMLSGRYGIPPDHIFSSRSPSFAPAIMSLTKGQGVDVVLNSLKGPLLKASWECISRFGRFVEMGKVDIDAARLLEMSPFRRSVTFASLDLIQYSDCRGHIVQRALSSSMQVIHDLKVRGCSPLHPITTYPISQARKAMSFMRTGKHMGKLVLVPDPADQVLVRGCIAPPVSLNGANSMYLVVGGLGGLGHSIASWMITKAGARNMMVVSRNAQSHPRARALQTEAEAHSCTLHVRNCDVADPAAIRELLAGVATSGLPPIAGVIHVAGVLRDTIFERMTYDQWRETAQPKVAGCWTLHECLPNVQFFVMLSSSTGIMGNPSQANYVAGNTFQDALARHRTTHGQAAVTIDLGPVEDAGILAENTADLRRRTERSLGMIYLPVQHVVSLVEDAIRRPLRPVVDDSQVITCMPQFSALPREQGLLNDNRLGTLRLGDIDAHGAHESNHDSGGDPTQKILASRLEKFLSQRATWREFAFNQTEADRSRLVTAVCDLLAAKVADFFDIPITSVDCGLSLPQHGVDSLVAVDFRNWISSVLQAKITIFDILQSPSITHVADLVAASTGLVDKKA